jgi:hypothetical protein
MMSRYFVVPAEAGIQHCQNPEEMTYNMLISKQLYIVLTELNKRGWIPASAGTTLGKLDMVFGG